LEIKLGFENKLLSFGSLTILKKYKRLSEYYKNIESIDSCKHFSKFWFSLKDLF